MKVLVAQISIPGGRGLIYGMRFLKICPIYYRDQSNKTVTQTVDILLPIKRRFIGSFELYKFSKISAAVFQFIKINT